MRTVDRIAIAAPIDVVFGFASDVLAWPAILPHYRYVRLESPPGDEQLVTMSANRPFGLFDWPTWWTSRMWIDRENWEVRYRHVRGITTGMDVVWRVRPSSTTVVVDLVHEWSGPRWPLIRYPAANWVIGPIFVHGIATRTLAGIKRAAESA